MGKRDRGIREKQRKRIKKDLFFLHHLPEMRQGIREKLRGAFCADKLKIGAPVLF